MLVPPKSSVPYENVAEEGGGNDVPDTLLDQPDVAPSAANGRRCVMHALVKLPRRPVSVFMPSVRPSVDDVAMKFMSMKTCGGSTSSSSQRFLACASLGAVPVNETALTPGM